MMMKFWSTRFAVKPVVGLAAGLCLLFSAPEADAQRMTQQSAVGFDKSSGAFEMQARLSTGLLSGEANEYVYWPEENNHQASRLIWQLDSIYMLSGGLSMKPCKWMIFNGDLSVKMNKGSGTMDDYDWLVPGWDWTHWSHHEDLEVTKGTILDINVEMPFRATPALSFSALLGYQYDNWEWEARGGSYIYSYYDFRDTEGDFEDGELAITYEQTFHAPYLGLGMDINFGRGQFNARVIGSPVVTAEALDHHHMRDLVTTDEFTGETMMAVDAGLSYGVTANLALSVNYNYTKYERMQGDSEWDYSGEVISYADSAGADLEYSEVSVELAYTF